MDIIKTHWSKIKLILPIIICLLAMLLFNFVKPFRGTDLYAVGTLSSYTMLFIGVLWSLINSIFLILKHKSNLKQNIIWIIISALPFLYVKITFILFFIELIISND